MTYRIQIQECAVKSLKKIHEPNKTYIKEGIERLKDFSQTMKNIKPLQGEYKGLYRLRVGDYRIVFDVLDTNIIILDIFIRQRGY
jgi:mRNA interferase RelE/StbE